MKNSKLIIFSLLLLLFLIASCRPQYYVVKSNELGGIVWSTLTPMSEAQQDTLRRLLQTELVYDTVPVFHAPCLLSPAKDYDSQDYNTFAVYTNPHTVAMCPAENPLEKIAIWCTPEATFLVFVDEQKWTKMYYHTSSKNYLRDSFTGECFPIREILYYPLDQTYWIEGVPGEWACRVLVYPPLPKKCTHIDIMSGTQELKKIKGTTGWRKRNDYLNVNVAALQIQQFIAAYKETVVVK